MLKNSDPDGTKFSNKIKEEKKEEIKEKKKERETSFRYIVLARVATGIFWGSILVLLIGTFWRCKHAKYDKNNFFNQKLI